MTENELVKKVARAIHAGELAMFNEDRRHAAGFKPEVDWPGLSPKGHQIYFAGARAAFRCILGEQWEQQVESLPLLPHVRALVEAVRAVNEISCYRYTQRTKQTIIAQEKVRAAVAAIAAAKEAE